MTGTLSLLSIFVLTFWGRSTLIDAAPLQVKYIESSEKLGDQTSRNFPILSKLIQNGLPANPKLNDFKTQVRVIKHLNALISERQQQGQERAFIDPNASTVRGKSHDSNKSRDKGNNSPADKLAGDVDGRKPGLHNAPSGKTAGINNRIKRSLTVIKATGAIKHSRFNRQLGVILKGRRAKTLHF